MIVRVSVTVLPRTFATSLAAAAVLALALAGCECEAPPAAPVPHQESTRGDEIAADHGPAARIGALTDLEGHEDFELVPLSLAERSERARSWSARSTPASPDAAARRSTGNWLCRLETHFGPPPEVTAAGFRYALRERTSGYVLTAFADAGGPALGGVLRDDQRPIDLERMTAIVDGFARWMDATIPEPCQLVLGGGARVFGVAAGEWFDRVGPVRSE